MQNVWNVCKECINSGNVSAHNCWTGSPTEPNNAEAVASTSAAVAAAAVAAAAAPAADAVVAHAAAAAAADVVAAAAAHTQEHNFYENQMMEVSAKNKSKGQYRNM